MGDTAQRAAALKPYLSASITDAGTDWPAGPSTEVLDRCRQFLTAAQQDLTWRAQVIERIEGATSKGGVKGAEFAFPSARSAHAAGIIAGDIVKAAWSAYEADPSLVNWRALQSALGDRKGKTSDPEYAAGLLTQMGASAFAGILRAESAKNQNNRNGYAPADLTRAKKDLAPLAEAFASADSTGKAPADLRARLLDKTPLDDLAAVLALAPQSTGFVVAAGTRLAKAAGHKSPDLDWNTHWLVKSLTHDLAATQQLLADPATAALLLRPEVVKGTGTPGFEKLLATALNKALSPTAGTPTLRRTAWINTIKTLGEQGAWSSLTPSISERTGLPIPSPVGQVLTRHVHQYFSELSAVWMNRGPKANTTGPGWTGLTAEQVIRFFGGIFRDPAALPVLEKDYKAFVSGLDLGKGNPFGDAPTSAERDTQRAVFIKNAKEAGGIASLLIGGLHTADLSAEEARDLYIQLAMFPLDVMAGAVADRMGAEVLLAETAVGKAADIIVKGPLQEVISNFWDMAPPGEASDLTDRLLAVQTEALNESLREHRMTTLSSSDQEYLQFTFKGMLYDALHDALQERGG
ncbi:hypothetical protein [Sphaerisporangium corydalis]